MVEFGSMSLKIARMKSRRVVQHDWDRYLSMSMGLLITALCLPTSALAQVTASRDSASTPAGLHPDLHVWREAGLSVLGGGLLLSGYLAPITFRDVPAQGFDPVEIDWSLDRRVIGDHSPGVSVYSDWTRNAAIIFPLVLTATTSPRDARWSGLGRTAVVHAETLLISQGLSLLGKKVLGRARPYAYLPATVRPNESSYDVSRERTFRSMPSGHSLSAWAGATMGMTEYLLSRPEASWLARAGVGFLGGALAGATSSLRVEAGQHFPSDVVAGAGLGIVVGVTIPLLHRGARSGPSSRAWLQMTGGALLGTLLGSVAVQEF